MVDVSHSKSQLEEVVDPRLVSSERIRRNLGVVADSLPVSLDSLRQVYRQIASALPPSISPVGFAVLSSIALLERSCVDPLVLDTFEDAGGFYSLAGMVSPDGSFSQRAYEAYRSMMDCGNSMVFG